MTARACAHCGKPLVQRENEQPRKFAARMTCDFSCGAQLGHQRLIERAMRVHGIDAAELHRRAAAGLCACGDPVRIARRARRKTCGKRQCRGFSAAMTCDDYFDGERVLHWPEVTGPIVADFSGQNLAFKAQWLGARLSRVDLRQSLTGCSAAYTAGVA